MWQVYIIYSKKIDHYYVGVTNNLTWFLERHNQSWGRYTKRGIPWKVVHAESFEHKTDVLKREKEIKRSKRRKYIERLINR
jgi:putative endonuclease